MFYKNLSGIPKTFHGVTFAPGEIKEVSEYINHPDLLAMLEPENKSDKPQSTKNPNKEEKEHGSDSSK